MEERLLHLQPLSSAGWAAPAVHFATWRTGPSQCAACSLEFAILETGLLPPRYLL